MGAIRFLSAMINLIRRSIVTHVSPVKGEQLKLRRACDYCTSKKAGCTGGQPCLLCSRKGLDCVFSVSQKQRLPRAETPKVRKITATHDSSLASETTCAVRRRLLRCVELLVDLSAPYVRAELDFFGQIFVVDSLGVFVFSGDLPCS